jgi:hypothetical protein
MKPHLYFKNPQEGLSEYKQRPGGGKKNGIAARMWSGSSQGTGTEIIQYKSQFILNAMLITI